MNDAVRKTIVSPLTQEISFREFPEAKQTILEGILEHIAPMIPKWIQRVTFVNLGEAQDEEGAACRVSVETAYRFAEIVIFQDFWEESGPSRVHCLVHELLHMPLEPIAITIREFVDAYVEEDSPARKLLEKQLQNAVETSMQDLAHSYTALVNRYAPIPE